MREQITHDLAAAIGKTAPPATVAVATAAGALNPQSVLVWLTIVYTAALLFSTIVKNWGDWMLWWGNRWKQAKRLWRALRGKTR